jgi:hypothetical protein
VNPNGDVFLIGGLMHCAAADGQTEIMGILQNWGGDVNGIDGWGGTPAHAAVKCKQLKSLRWLLAHGADPSITNRHGLSVGQFVTNEITGPESEEFLSVINGKTRSSESRTN